MLKDKGKRKKKEGGNPITKRRNSLKELSIKRRKTSWLQEKNLPSKKNRKDVKRKKRLMLKRKDWLRLKLNRWCNTKRRNRRNKNKREYKNKN